MKAARGTIHDLLHRDCKNTFPKTVPQGELDGIRKVVTGANSNPNSRRERNERRVWLVEPLSAAASNLHDSTELPKVLHDGACVDAKSSTEIYWKRR